MSRGWVTIEGAIGYSGDREVLLGFAPAWLLHSVSFADILDDNAGRGYQRRFNPQHSLDFRRYIQRRGSSTIPLTLNARPSSNGEWRLVQRSGRARLDIRADAGRVLSQVDCQHRLGYLHDLEMPLPFMCFLGLTEREEMETFSVINSKAKGLSTSLLDFHAATLTANLAEERPELLIALHLNSDPASPWYLQLDLGGRSTSGLMRRASLRTMQKAVKHFLVRSRALKAEPVEAVAAAVLAFWSAVAQILSDAWANPRGHLLNKGVGVYALMRIAGDLMQEAGTIRECDKRYFIAQLADFLPALDWSTEGHLRGLGGEAGVKQAITVMRDFRTRSRLKAVESG